MLLARYALKALRKFGFGAPEVFALPHEPHQLVALFTPAELLILAVPFAALGFEADDMRDAHWAWGDVKHTLGASAHDMRRAHLPRLLSSGELADEDAAEVARLWPDLARKRKAGAKGGNAQAQAQAKPNPKLKLKLKARARAHGALNG